MQELRKSTVAIMAMCLIAACSPREEKENVSMPRASERMTDNFSPGLALLRAKNSIKETINCLMAEQKLTVAGRVLESFQKQHVALCSVYKVVNQQTSELNNKAISAHELPLEAFLFYSSQPCDQESSGNCDATIGLFKTLADCQKAEKLLRDVDIATRSCRNWKTELIYKLAQPTRK